MPSRKKASPATQRKTSPAKKKAPPARKTTEDALARKAAEVGRLRDFVDETSFSGNEQEISGELGGSASDQHPADSSDVTEQRARDYTIKQILEHEAEQIQDAQKRRAEGRYGICEECNKPIPRARLEARPEATLCINCQKKRED